MEDYEYIEEFILALQEEYPCIEFGYEYDDLADMFFISGKSEETMQNDADFNDFVQELANDYLIRNVISNFYFNCN